MKPNANPAGRPAGSPGWCQPRLFPLPPYRHTKAAMWTRLQAFREDFLMAHPDASKERLQKAVDNHRKMLDRVWRGE